MSLVTIYTTRFCPYCTAAKELLRRKKASVSEIDVTGDRPGRAKMSERAHGRTSVPQIFVGDTHVGGCDDLRALDARGGLDPLLSA